MPVCRLETREDVEALRLAVRWFDRPGYFRVELLAPNTLSSERCTVLRRRLAFALSDCGCFLASAVLLVIPLVLFFVVNYSPWPFWPNAVVYLSCMAVGALLAKLISLLLSYRMAHRCINEILASMPTPSSATPAAPDSECG